MLWAHCRQSLGGTILPAKVYALLFVIAALFTHSDALACEASEFLSCTTDGLVKTNRDSASQLRESIGIQINDRIITATRQPEVKPPQIINSGAPAPRERTTTTTNTGTDNTASDTTTKNANKTTAAKAGAK